MLARRGGYGQRKDRAVGYTGCRGEAGESIGTWRSLVAHLTGGQGVVGSNPAVPTQFKGHIQLMDVPFAYGWVTN